MTGVYPYARYDLNARVSAWALGGAGWGELTLERKRGRAMPTDFSMRLGAAGLTGRVLDGTGASGLAVNLRSDALWVETKTERTRDLVATEGQATRLRVVIQGERVFASESGATFTPSVELGLRHDAGDAETGAGVEAGAGLRYSAGRLSVEGSLRALLAHESSGYEEWGASGALALNPSPSGRGLSLRLSPTWGATGSAAERLWGAHDARALAPYGSEGSADARLESEIAYGLGFAKGHALVTPYAGATLGEGAARTLRAGTRWTLGEDAALAVEGTRGTESTLHLRGSLRF